LPDGEGAKFGGRCCCHKGMTLAKTLNFRCHAS
jgi:hypothetical protein